MRRRPGLRLLYRLLWSSGRDSQGRRRLWKGRVGRRGFAASEVSAGAQQDGQRPRGSIACLERRAKWVCRQLDRGQQSWAPGHWGLDWLCPRCRPPQPPPGATPWRRAPWGQGPLPGLGLMSRGDLGGPWTRRDAEAICFPGGFLAEASVSGGRGARLGQAPSLRAWRGGEGGRGAPPAPGLRTVLTQHWPPHCRVWPDKLGCLQRDGLGSGGSGVSHRPGGV